MAGPIRIAILASGGQARAEIRGVAAETDLLGKSFSRVGKLLAAGFAVDKIAEGVGAVYETGSKYVETLNKIQAITRSSNAQLDKAASTLEGQASAYGKMGETADDGADGLLELTKAGLSLKKSMAAVYPTMVLAKSGQLEVGDAATLVSNTLNSFSLKAKRAGDIANFIANAADASSADVTDLAESFKYVSPLAARAGVSLAQTNAVTAELANSGVKASQAGTSFRKFLLSLQAPTIGAAGALESLGIKVYDNQGKMKSLNNLLGQFHDSLGKVDDATRNEDLRAIFGLTGITGAQIIIKGGTEGLKEYTKAIHAAGGAERLANATSKGLSGTINSIKAEVETTAQSLYRKYSPAVDDALRGVVAKGKSELPDALDKARSAGEKVLPTLQNLAGAAKDFGTDAVAVAQGPLGQTFVGALKVTASTAEQVSSVLDSLPEPVRKLGIEAAVAAAILPRLRSGLADVGGMVKTQVGSLQKLRAEMVLAANGGVPQLSTGLAGLSSNSKSVAVDLGAVTPQATALRNSLLQVQKQAGTAGGALEGARVALSKLGPAASQAAGVGGMLLLVDGAQRSNKALSTLENTAGAAAAGFSVAGPWGAAIGGAAGLIGSLATKYGNANREADKAYREIQKTSGVQQAEDAMKGLSASLDQVTGAYTGATRAAVLHRLEDAGIIKQGTDLGLSQRQLINAALGQKGAFAAITPVVASYKDQLSTLDAQIQAVKDSEDSYVTSTVTHAGAARATTVHTDELTVAAKKQITALTEQKNAAEKSLTELQRMPGELQRGANEARAAAAATADYSGKLKGLPKGVVTRFDNQGVQARTVEVAKLAKQYKLTPKQIRTVIKAAGQGEAFTSVKKVQKAIDQLKNTKGDLSGWSHDIVGQMKQAIRFAGVNSDDVRKNLEKGPKKAKADVSPWVQSIVQGIGRGKAEAGKSNEVGAQMKAGILQGFAGTQASLVAQAVAAVAAAIAAAKARAKIHSPSKETQYIGEMMGAGLAVGLSKTSAQVTAAATQLTAGLLAALTDQSPIAANLQTISDYVSSQFDDALQTTSNSIDRKYNQIQRVLDNRYKATTAHLKKTLKGKAEDRALDKAEKAHEKLSNQIDRSRTKSQNAATKASKAAQAAALQATAAQRQALAANIEQQNQLQSGDYLQYLDKASSLYQQMTAAGVKNLDDAKSALQSLQDTASQYAASIKDAITASGSLSTLTQNGATSLARLIKQRTAAVADAKKFQADIAALTAAGLNATDLKDITDAGVSGGLSIAESILKGGSDAVSQMNTLSAQLQATGTELGTDTADTLYGAGITAAQGLVDGLAAQQTALSAVATTLGQQIAAGLAAGLASATSTATDQADKTAKKVTKKVKDRFKVKSPSRVFEAIGVNVVQGLGKGLARDAYATQQSSRLAERVTTGFGTPALDAYMSSVSGSASSAGESAASGVATRTAPLIGTVVQQQGESVDALAERLWFKWRTRG